MRIISSIFLLIILISCKQIEEKKEKSSKAIIDSVKIFKYKLNVTDSSIINNSNKEVDILINGSRNYLQGKYLDLKFNCDYIISQPIEEYNGHLIFANQLLITQNQIIFYQESIDKSKSSNKIESKSCYNQKLSSFKYSNGEGIIEFEKVSCNDTDLNNVILNYGNGSVKIKNMINARFFEYDIDKDGINEEYLLGVRNCSQEIVILRIRNRK